MMGQFKLVEAGCANFMLHFQVLWVVVKGFFEQKKDIEN